MTPTRKMFQQSKSKRVISGVHTIVPSTGHAVPVHYLRTVGVLAIPSAYLVNRKNGNIIGQLVKTDM